MNQIRFFLAGLVLVSSLVAQAFINLPTDPSDSPLTKIQNPQLICQARGVMYAINYETAGQERLWQADPGDTEGLELHVDKFYRSSDPIPVLKIKANLQMGGERIRVELEIQSTVVVSPTNPRDTFLRIRAHTRVNGELTHIMPCHHQ